MSRWGDYPTRSARFWAKVVDTGSCWEFRGETGASGYGRFWTGERRVMAHRYAWEDMVCEIPEGLVLDHLCRNRVCVNPEHLEPVSHAVNTRRGMGLAAVNARKFACKRGHAFDKDNTYLINGHRACKQCGRDRAREWYRANRDQIQLRRGKGTGEAFVVTTLDEFLTP